MMAVAVAHACVNGPRGRVGWSIEGSRHAFNLCDVSVIVEVEVVVVTFVELRDDLCRGW
jgi:hypothetical protein